MSTASRCEYCEDREGEHLDRWDCWACPRCEAEAERIWSESLAGRFEALHQEAMAIGGPIGRLLARQVRRVESELAEQRARITERILRRRR